MSDLFRNSEFPAETPPKSGEVLFDTLPPKPTEPNATIRAPATPSQLAELIPKQSPIVIIDESNDRDALLARLRTRASSLSKEHVESILKSCE